MQRHAAKLVLKQLVSLICLFNLVHSTSLQPPRSSACNETPHHVASEGPPSSYLSGGIDDQQQQQQLINVSSSSDSSPNVKQTQAPSGHEHLVVVDCGSSGSRIQIYYWPSGTPNQDLPDQIQTLRNPITGRALIKRIRPGLSSVRDDPQRASDYLVPLLKFASDHVPREQHKSTPIYVLGTAGLRSLTLHERSHILDDVMRDSIKEFDFELIEAKVISGSEEGFFQWLSVNLLAHRLRRSFEQAQSLAFHFQRPEGRRLGLIEMGGVSAQITFEVTPAMDQLISHRLSGKALRVFEQLRLEIGLKYPAKYLEVNAQDQTDQQVKKATNISVFSVSFLGFGSDNARSLAIDLLVRDAMTQLSARSGGSLLPLMIQPNSTLVLEDPCLPRLSEDVVLKPASVLYSPDKTIGYNSARPSDQAIQVRLVGKGNFNQCRGLIGRLIVLSKREKTTCMQLDSHNICDSSLIGTNFIPWQQLQFVGLGDLFYTTKLVDTSGRFNGASLLYQTVSLCAKSLKEIDELHSADDDFSRTRNKLACFKASWILAWLTTVLRLPLDTSVNVTTTDQVLDEEVDWKLGAVLAQTVGYSAKWAKKEH